MNQYRQSHNRLVRDTNEGSIVPAERGSGQGLGSIPSLSSPAQTQSATSNRLETLDVMMGMVDPSIQARVQEDQDRRFMEGYNSADRAEVANQMESDQNPFSKFLFGKSPELRGVQQKILDTDTKQWNLERVNDIETDAARFDSEEDYANYLADSMKAKVDQYDDPDIRDQLIAQYSNAAEDLSWRFKAQFEARKQGDMAEATKAGVRVASKLYETDPDNHLDTLIDSLQLAEGQDENAWAENMTALIQEELTEGRMGVYQQVLGSDLGNHLSSDQRAAIESAKSIYDMKNDENALEAMWSLEQAVGTGDEAGVRQYAEMINEIKPGAVDTNQQVLAARRQRERILEQRRREHEKQLRRKEGKGSTTEALDAGLMQWGQAKFQHNIQVNPDLTDEQKEELLSQEFNMSNFLEVARAHPEEVIQQLEYSPGTKSAMLDQLFTQTSALIGGTSELNADETMFIEEVGTLFSMMSDSNSQMLGPYVGNEQMIDRLRMFTDASKTGLPLHAIRDNINRVQGQTFNVGDITGARMDNLSDQAFDQIKNEMGEDRWFGMRKGLDNEDQIRGEFQEIYQRKYEQWGPELAGQMAYAELKDSAVLVNGNLQFGLRGLEDHMASVGSTTEDYVNLMSNLPEIQEHLRALDQTGSWAWIKDLKSSSGMYHLTDANVDVQFVGGQLHVYVDGGDLEGRIPLPPFNLPSTEEQMETLRERLRPDLPQAGGDIVSNLQQYIN